MSGATTGTAQGHNRGRTPAHQKVTDPRIQSTGSPRPGIAPSHTRLQRSREGGAKRRKLLSSVRRKLLVVGARFVASSGGSSESTFFGAA